MKPSITAVILAAGKGTRMKSAQAKVLHQVFFKPMLHHVLDTVLAANIEQCAVIVGHQRQRVLDSLGSYSISPVFQEEQLGTGHAVLCARDACNSSDLVMILCGDTPLIQSQTLEEMITHYIEGKAAVSLMTTVLDDPFGYGRIISGNEGEVLEIVEQKDATLEQRQIQEINAGIYLASSDFLFQALEQVGTDNSQGEVYLTDIVAIAKRSGQTVQKFTHPRAIDVLGVNSRVELAQAHQELQIRHNREVMLSGVTMFSPETTLIQPGTTIGQDTVIHGGVQILAGTSIGAESLVESNCTLKSARIGKETVIGTGSIISGATVAERKTLAPLSLLVEKS